MRRVQAILEWWGGTRPGRALTRYGDARGPLLARGMSFSAIFSVFAGLYVLFAVFGIWFEASPGLRDGVIGLLETAVPGLLDTGGGGALPVDALFSVPALGISGLIVLAVLANTAAGWLGAFREGVQTIFGLPKPGRPALLIWLLDLAALLGIGVLLLVSAVLSIAASRVLGLLLAALELDTAWAGPATATGALAVALVLDTATLYLLFRVQARVPVPTPQLLVGAVLGAVGYGVLKYVGATLLTGAGSNPLLAGFAVIIGLLVWFNLMMQWLLLLAAWLAEGPRSDGAAPSDSAAPASAPVVRIEP